MKFKIDFKEILNYVATKKFWIELIIMTLGMIVTACAVYYFLVPSKLIIGTISGLSIVISGICEKMIRRHPHVFGTEDIKTSAEVLVKWEEIKKEEKSKIAFI